MKNPYFTGSNTKNPATHIAKKFQPGVKPKAKNGPKMFYLVFIKIYRYLNKFIWAGKVGSNSFYECLVSFAIILKVSKLVR